MSSEQNLQLGYVCKTGPSPKMKRLKKELENYIIYINCQLNEIEEKLNEMLNVWKLENYEKAILDLENFRNRLEEVMKGAPKMPKLSK